MESIMFTKLEKVQLKMFRLLELYSLISIALMTYNAYDITFSRSLLYCPITPSQDCLCNDCDQTFHYDCYLAKNYDNCTSEFCLRSCSMNQNNYCLNILPSNCLISIFVLFIAPSVMIVVDMFFVNPVIVLEENSVTIKWGEYFLSAFLCLINIMGLLCMWLTLPVSIWKIWSRQLEWFKWIPFTGRFYMYQTVIWLSPFILLDSIFYSIKNLFSEDYNLLNKASNSLSVIKLFLIDIIGLAYSIVYLNTFNNSIIILILHSFMILYRIVSFIRHIVKKYCINDIKTNSMEMMNEKSDK
jgi:hypothetical protein